MEEQPLPEHLEPKEHSGAEEVSSPLLVPGAIIIAGALIAGAVLYANGHGTGTGSQNNLAGSGTAPVVEGNLVGDGPVLGNPQAPVTIVEFADFQCPYCSRLFKTTLPDVIDNYVKTGKAKLVYRNFAFLGDESTWAGEAALCAREQNKFWEYHDYLFTHQGGENQGAFARKNLKQFARELGLDGAKFDACLDQDTYLDQVKKDTEAGRNAGVSGTPTTFVNGKGLVGAVPTSQFDAAIADAMKKGK